MIFTALGLAIAGALSLGSVAATIISGALAFGARLLVGYLSRPKKRKYAAVQGQVQYGADTPASAVYGTTKVKGQRIYYAKYDKGNKWNADVFALANGWCDGLKSEIYFYGQKYTLKAATKIGNEIEHWTIDGFEDILSIRFYDGRPGQQADAKLVSDTASLGQNWKSTSTVAGCAYVVVQRKYDSKKFSKGRPDFSFILRGLREYDPRKDSTYPGGSGTQRLDDPSTWAYTENPAIHRLNYLLGVKGLVSGRTLIGVGKSLAAIDVDSHIAAANVCDTIRSNGKPTYRCSLFVQGDDEHTEILAEFEDAMAGYRMNRAGLSGVIPGAPQIPVATITKSDIRTDEAQQLSLRKSAYELYNVISGQFTSKESQWEPESLKTVTVNADVTADKHKRQTSNDFLQVTDPDIAQYLLNIRYRQNRKGGSATLPVSRRLGIRCDIGSWVNYLDKTWLVTGRQWSAKLKCTLSLAETGSDVYSEDGIEPGPIVIPPLEPVNPSLLTTVENFAVAAGLIKGPEGYDVPALTFTWDPPEDPTIQSVRFEYQVDPDDGGDGTIFRDQCDDPEAGTYTTTKNVVSLRTYDARATIDTIPDRLRTFTEWKTTASGTGKFAFPVSGEELAADIKRMRDFTGDGVRAALDAIQRLEKLVADHSAAGYDNTQLVRTELTASSEDTKAGYTKAILVATGPDSAIAQSLTTLTAQIDDAVGVVNVAYSTSATSLGDAMTIVSQALTQVSAAVANNSASGLFRAYVSSTQSGATATVALAATASSGAENPGQAALYLNAKSDGSSEIVLAAARSMILNGSTLTAMFQSGKSYFNNALINGLTANNIDVSNLVASSAFIQNLTVGTSNIDSGAVSSFGFSGTDNDGSASVTVNTTNAYMVLVIGMCTASVVSSGGGAGFYDCSITRGSATLYSTSLNSLTNYKNSGAIIGVDTSPPSGSATYNIQQTGGATGGYGATTSFTTNVTAIVLKR